jgi:uncharacterized protein with NRDE domain
MCLALIAWRAHPRYPLVVVANRDEFHARAAAPLARWSDPPAMLAGRDLQAGGTWLGLDDRGRFGLVTNFRERLRPRANAPSRGLLIPAFLAADRPPGEHLSALETDAPGYSGFNLLLASEAELWYASNREDGFGRVLPSGVYGLANHLLDAPWPKLVRTRTRLRKWLADAATDRAEQATGELLQILADREPGAVDPALATGLPSHWERALSAPFVLLPEYGTRCSTVLLGDAEGRMHVIERRFGPDGTTTGETRLSLDTRNLRESDAV